MSTIRVDDATHAQLVALSREMGSSLMDTVRAAAEALRRQRFADTVAGQLQALQRDPEAWAAYLADAELTVGDGLGR
ncbi:MAG: hypothetical protein AB7W59_24015 [Acidimicrobiia bacterium]